MLYIIEYDTAGWAEPIPGGSYGSDGDEDEFGDQEIAPGGSTGDDDQWYLCDVVDYGTYKVILNCEPV